ncbi:hypothetical protein ACFYYB_09245 [Streptomyces sp. NPDC002886]|uniref:hypothetical protein n=1 Tax=Streptomyces sp. NPDC002886 TaxID=3364667 RepID=UPI00367C0AF0
MGDNTLWVGVLTAGTAVLASWVTSRGTARAARIQAETTAAVQRADQRRTARRTAYADVIEQAQKMGDLYWKVNDAHAEPDPEVRIDALKDLRLRLRDAYASLRHLVRIVELEGPQEVAEAAYRLRRSTSDSYEALEDMIGGDAGAIERFNECYAPFWAALVALVAVARGVLQDDAVPAAAPAPVSAPVPPPRTRRPWVRRRPGAGGRPA